MEYRINPASMYSNTFTLPVSVTDEHLRMAGTMQLRVLLWLFRHAFELPASSQTIGRALGMDENEVNDAFEYWLEKGLVLTADMQSVPPVQQSAPVQPAPVHTSPLITEEPLKRELTPEKEKVVEAITVNPPTHEEFVRRCGELKEFRDMLLIAEQRFGSTLSFNMQSTLLMLHDDYGLSVEVIMLAIEYAVSRKKTTPRFLANVGKLWCEQEIDTIDRATEYIESQGAVEKHWSEFRDATGVKNPSPTKAQREYLHSWINTMHFSMEMITLAYEEMANNTDKFSFPYMNKILVNWDKQNIRTPSEAMQAKKERSEKYAAAKKSADEEKPAPSYDLSAYEKTAFMNPLDYLKDGE